MDGHTLLGHLAFCADAIGDGGPRIPSPRTAANAKTTPAPWFFGEDEDVK